MIVTTDLPHKKERYGKSREMLFNTAGMTFRLTADKQHELEEAAPLSVELTREPTNVQDRNAVAIHLTEHRPGMHIGYVPKDIAARLAPLMDAGEIRFVEAWLLDMEEYNGRMRIVFQKKSS
jgi:hypothetical protein